MHAWISNGQMTRPSQSSHFGGPNEISQNVKLKPRGTGNNARRPINMNVT